VKIGRLRFDFYRSAMLIQGEEPYGFFMCSKNGDRFIQGPLLEFWWPGYRFVWYIENKPETSS